MKKQKIIKELEEAMDSVEELIKASKGEKSRCTVKEFDNIELYVNTWIRAGIERALEELKK